MALVDLELTPSEYYSKFYPYSLLKLLMDQPRLYDLPSKQHGVERREVAFGFTKMESGRDVHTIMQRYQMFPAATAEQLLKQRFVKAQRGSRIDIGGIYSQDAAVAKRFHTRVEFRELVFDVDLDKEYNRFRTCECAKVEKEPPFVCPQCWPFLTLAVRVIDHILAWRFGFHDTLWLFSGRRGVHCWVLDPEAGTLPDQSRRAITKFFENFTLPTANPEQWINHQPALMDLYTNILRPAFNRMIEKQQVRLSDINTLNVIANSLSGMAAGDHQMALLQQLEKCELDRQAGLWARLMDVVERFGNERALVNIVFYVMFPRLDSNVTPDANHLLRCPMSIHNETYGIVTPLDIATMDEIDPRFLPNLRMGHTLMHLERCVRTFQDALLCRLPVASYLVCPVCCRGCTRGIDIDMNAVFYNDKTGLQMHVQESHLRALTDFEGCTLRDWVNQATAQPDGSVNRAKKYDLYRILQTRFSR